MHHIFGPVPSRRLGRSLGIDLIPFKTCSFDCVYCECGATTDHTTRREEFFPTGEILAELDENLKTDPDLDYITLAGSGEPTLSASLGMVIAYLKDHHPRYRVAVLTNGSLLSDPAVRQELSRADLVIPTLSTTSRDTFERIHRPVPGLSPDQIIKSLIAFRNEYRGAIWLEVFLIPPLNTSREELSSLRQAIGAIMPDRIQLNMLDRPGTEKWVRPMQPDEIEQIRKYLAETGIPTDITGNSSVFTQSCGNGRIALRIEETLRRRPCTPEDIAGLTGLHPAEVRKQLARMQQQGILTTYRGTRGIFYRPAGQQDD